MRKIDSNLANRRRLGRAVQEETFIDRRKVGRKWKQGSYIGKKADWLCKVTLLRGQEGSIRPIT